LSKFTIRERKHLQSIERLLRRALRIERTKTSLPKDQIKQPEHRMHDAQFRSERQTQLHDSQTKQHQRKKRYGGKFGGKKRERLVSSPDQWRRY
jgi:hypothetical protein